MVHGRFQPFHNEHLDYLRAAWWSCERIIVGITNPDPSQIAEEGTSSHRHLPPSNPFTYFQRMLMVREVLADEDIPPERTYIVPFPIHFPDRWRYYVPREAVHFVRVFSEWEQAKVDRLRRHGYRVVVLHPGTEKRIEATEVRRRLATGGNWEELVPPGVARVIRSIQQVH
jgi:cytidyltransferase-like protein